MFNQLFQNSRPKVFKQVIFLKFSSISSITEEQKVLYSFLSVNSHLKGVLHLLSKISMFCALFQHNQQLCEK